MQPRKVVQITWCPEQAVVDAHVDQHRIAAADLLAAGSQCCLHLAHGDLMAQRCLRQVEADSLGVEVLERHFIDRRCGRID